MTRAVAKIDDPMAQADQIFDLLQEAFGDFSRTYLLKRLPTVPGAVAHVLEERGEWLGLKLGYRRSDRVFYSWLGGVRPAARRCGVMRLLTGAQHHWAAAAGFDWVETRTRDCNRAMIELNRACGFVQSAVESDPDGFRVVTFRKALRDGLDPSGTTASRP